MVKDLADSTDNHKPTRLNFETYLSVVENAPGTEMFRHFYLQYPDGTRLDAIENGSNACAFFVSSVLTIFQKIKRVHGTVTTTIEDLEESGWQQVSELIPGDVIVWAPTLKNDNHRHVGFYVGRSKAISTSTAQRKVVQHDLHFGDENREITHMFRNPGW